MSTFMAINTLLTVLAFTGICWWAFSKKNKDKFEKAARYPIEEE